MNGVELILGERVRQLAEKGYHVEHDAQHRDGSLAVAGGCYAIWGHYTELRPVYPQFWPWEPADWKPSTDRIEVMTRAGALIAAEIDRLLRRRGMEGH